MDTKQDDFAEWLTAETAKTKKLVHSPETWTRKNADTRMDELRAAQKIWDEFKATRSPRTPP